MMQAIEDWRAAQTAAWRSLAEAVRAAIATAQLFCRRVSLVLGWTAVGLMSVWLGGAVGQRASFVDTRVETHAPVRPLDPIPVVSLRDEGYLCWDGNISHAKHRGGACSNHGGVRRDLQRSTVPLTR